MQYLPSSSSVPTAPLGGILLRIGSVVFVVESLIMLGFSLVEPQSHNWLEALLDASILTVIASVILHRWIIAPLDKQLKATMAQLREARFVAEWHARTDSLTGVLNRRAIFERLEREWSNAKRTRIPLTFLLLDIDFFKRINDTYGHLAGDAVLKQLAQLMQSNCGVYSDIGRYGGEEFCMLLAGTRLTDAVDFAEHLRTAIAEMVVTHNDHCFSVTVSIGVTQQEPQTSNMSTLIESADQALYDAKRSGRNRVQAMTHGDDEPLILGDLVKT